MHRAPSPYRSSSPFAPHSMDRMYTAQQTLPTGAAQVGPGTTIVVSQPGPDGRMTYQPHTAVSASYQTPSGIVSGIQWIPTEPANYAPPSGTQHVSVSGSDPSSWGISYSSSLSDRHRAEEKKKKQEEKEANRYREQEARNNSEYERIARERDAQVSGIRDRSRSFSAGSAPPPASVPFPGQGASSAYPTHPTVAANGYPTNPYSNYGTPMGPPQPPVVPSVYPTGFTTHSRNHSGSFSDITRQMKEMELDRNKEHPEPRSRKSSSVGRSGAYSTSENPYERSRTISGNYPDRPNPNANSNPYPPGAYPSVQPYNIPTKTQIKYPDSYPSASRYVTSSPNMRPSDIASYGTASSTGYGSDYSSTRTSGDPILRSTTPFGNPTPQFYPRGHILEGQPIINNMMSQSRSRASSRAPSPNPVTKPSSYSGKSPYIPAVSIPAEPQQLAAPEAFSRPINAANSFTLFDLIKVQDMEDLCDPPYPKMPPVLTTHDIYHDDWKRCMQDLGRSWTGQLPVPGLGQDGLPPRRSTLAVDLVSLWNQSFFFPRGVELILYKGRERRTGPQAGQAAVRLPKYNDADDSSSSSSSSSSSDSEDSDYGKRMTDPYGRPLAGQVEIQEARRRREEKQEKKRRRKEKKARRKAKARDKTYTVYVACLPRGPTAIPYNSRPGAVQGGLGTTPTIPAGYVASAYAPPNAMTAYGVPNTTPAYGTPNATPAYGAPIGIPVSRSYGYGGGY